MAGATRVRIPAGFGAEEWPRRPLPRRESKRLFEPGRVTLDDRIVSVWARLVDSGRAECPVCDGEMVAGSGCRSCGSELS